MARRNDANLFITKAQNNKNTKKKKNKFYAF